MNAVIDTTFAGPVRVAKAVDENGRSHIRCIVTSEDVKAYPKGLVWVFRHTDAFKKHKYVGIASNWFEGKVDISNVREVSFNNIWKD